MELEMSQIFLLVYLAVISSFFCFAAQFEKSKKKRQRLKRELARRESRSRERETRQRLRSNAYLALEEEPKLREFGPLQRMYGRLACRPIIGLVIELFEWLRYQKHDPRYGRATALSDFDDLNREAIRHCKESDSGYVQLFPYRYMDFGKLSFGWQPLGGANNDSPALVYLVEHDRLKAVKVGITSLAARTDRIRSHTNQGWRPVQFWSVASLRIARNVEQAVISWWRYELGIEPALTTKQMPQGGHTETASLNRVDLEQIKNRVDDLITSNGQEQILDFNEERPLVGSVVHGVSTVVATRIWEPSSTRRPRTGKAQVSGKCLIVKGSTTLTLELYGHAYSESVRKLIPDIETQLVFRGRIQQIGDAYRIANPWLWTGSQEVRPRPRYDLI